MTLSSLLSANTRRPIHTITASEIRTHPTNVSSFRTLNKLGSPIVKGLAYADIPECIPAFEWTAFVPQALRFSVGSNMWTDVGKPPVYPLLQCRNDFMWRAFTARQPYRYRSSISGTIQSTDIPHLHDLLFHLEHPCSGNV